MPSASSHLRSAEPSMPHGSPALDHGGMQRSQYNDLSYQSPRLQLQHGSPRDFTPTNQSPLARHSAEYSPSNLDSLRASLDWQQPASASRYLTADRGKPSPSADVLSSASGAPRRPYAESGDISGEAYASSSRAAAPGDHSTYRKSLLSEYRNSLGAESVASPIKQSSVSGGVGKAVPRQSHHQTPLATETSNFSPTVVSPNSVKDPRLKLSSTSVQPQHSPVVKEGGAINQPAKWPGQKAAVAAQPQISVFNYEGGDRSSSRNHLHMMMNHNLMNAHHQENEKIKKRSHNLKKSRRKITVNLQGTRYDVVREVVEKLGYTVTKDDDSSAYLLWNDTYVSTDKISEMKSFQRINHFPGMGEICRKDCLARNMSKYVTLHEYDLEAINGDQSSYWSFSHSFYQR